MRNLSSLLDFSPLSGVLVSKRINAWNPKNALEAQMIAYDLSKFGVGGSPNSQIYIGGKIC